MLSPLTHAENLHILSVLVEIIRGHFFVLIAQQIRFQRDLPRKAQSFQSLKRLPLSRCKCDLHSTPFGVPCTAFAIHLLR
jgi:hypothetical protein